MPEPLTVYTISPSPDSTIAVEIKESGLRKRKRLFVFERFSGQLLYDPDQPLKSTLRLHIEVDSLADRDARQVLSVGAQGEITLESRSFRPKPLRGLVAEGTLTLRGLQHHMKANIEFGSVKRGRIHIEGDAALSLSHLGLPRPTSLFGLIRTDDMAVLHASLRGVSQRDGGVDGYL